MKDPLARDERAFVDSIDCLLPYRKPDAVSALIEKGRSLSLNADIAVLDEITNAPPDERLDRAQLEDLVERWQATFAHPLKSLLLRLAAKLISCDCLPYDECVEAIQAVSKFPGQYSALSMVYRVLEPGPEAELRLRALQEQIWADWDELSG